MRGDQQVVLIRHGETAWSKSGQHTGRTDLALTELGEACARQLPRALRGWRFTQVLTSPLRRAKDTCRLAGLLDQARESDDLMEWDYGELEGLTSEQIRAKTPNWSVWDEGPPGGETLEEVAERADRVIQEVRLVDGDVALFAHGHLLRVLAARWLGLSPRAGQKLLFGTCALGVLGYEHGIEPALVRWNDQTHLPEGT